MEIKTERADPAQTLYMERVEAAGMATLTKALTDGQMTLAWDVARLLRFLSLV
uniref:Uncharacterized protein n=1 Tax=uncultured prokaryote TaxID=198431 RepID=A0A0H5Q4K2_9ZZZZ|nr:hypothetical protein [uncultured prokaryote]